MKTALVNCPMIPVDAPPLGLAYLATYLAKKGKDIAVLDINIDFYHTQTTENKGYWGPKFSQFWYLEAKYNEIPFIKKEIYEFYANKILLVNPDIVGFTATSTTVFFIKGLVDVLKKINPNLFIILGGASAHRVFSKEKEKKFEMENKMHNYADAIVVGESEETFLDLINQLEAGGEINCPGVCIKRGDEWIDFGMRTPISNLDLLPFPDYSFFPVDKYTEKNMIRILGSRGCYAKCVFCTDTMIWQKYRTRSARDIFLEMKLRRLEGHHHMEFNDSTLNGDLNVLNELCDLLISANMDILWGGNARIRKEMDLTFLTKMYKAGCRKMSVGIESASQKVLDDMNKNLKIEEVVDFLKNAKQAGIKISVNWVVGFPTETQKDFEKTKKFIQEYSSYFVECAVSTLSINPHTLIERYPEKFGIIYDKDRIWRTKDKKNLPKVREKRFFELMEIVNKTVGPVNYFTNNR